jgi:hypothetical protein
MFAFILSFVSRFASSSSADCCNGGSCCGQGSECCD